MYKKIALIGANQPISNLTNYFGPYRISLGNLVILTMCEEPMCSDEKRSDKGRRIHDRSWNHL